MTAYSSARDEYSSTANIYLDANENAYSGILDGGYCRYPDPQQSELKRHIAQNNGVQVDQLFLGNGSDEAIDLLIRATCNPGVDNIIVMPPTYGMYEVSARLNDVEVRSVSLDANFDLDTNAVLNEMDDSTKLIFICSPNNPTGNTISNSSISNVLEYFQGLVVVDEAYIDFAETRSWVEQLEKYSNLVVLQTFSKAWGLAGLRLGVAYANEQIISVLNKIKPPYNINECTQRLAIQALDDLSVKNDITSLIIENRKVLNTALLKLDIVNRVYPSSANFLLVEFDNANSVYEYLLKNGIVVRNRASLSMCNNCLRISIGTKDENNLLIEMLKSYKR